MKNYLLAAVMAILAGVFVTLESCKGDKDPCEDVSCMNDGVCVDGTCNCNETYYGTKCETKCVKGKYENGGCTCSNGYEGDVCDEVMRAKFLGTWKVKETCKNINQEYNYQMVIEESSDGILVFTIDNFRDKDSNPLVVCEVVKADSKTMTISEQNFGNGQKIEGSGSFNSTGDTLTIDYTLKLSNGSDICTMKLYK